MIELVYTTLKQKKVKVYFPDTKTALVKKTDIETLLNITEAEANQMTVNESTEKYYTAKEILSMGEKTAPNMSNDFKRWVDLMTEEQPKQVSDDFNRVLFKMIKK